MHARPCPVAGPRPVLAPARRESPARDSRAGLGRAPSLGARPDRRWAERHARVSPRAAATRAEPEAALGVFRSAERARGSAGQASGTANVRTSGRSGTGTRPGPWPRTPPRVREQSAVQPDRGLASGGFPNGKATSKNPGPEQFQRARGRHRGLHRLARRGVARTARPPARLALGGLGRQEENARSDRCGEGKT